VATWYEPDEAGLAQLRQADFVVDEMQRRVDLVKGRGEDISPVRTGEYKASWHSESGVRDGEAYGEVSNTAPHAVFLEYGTRYMDAQHPMGRAIDAAKD